MTLESIAPLSDGVPITLPTDGSLNVPALTRREPRRAQRSYTTRRDTISSPSHIDWLIDYLSANVSSSQSRCARRNKRRSSRVVILKPRGYEATDIWSSGS